MNHCQEDMKRVYNLYEFWTERKEALRLWHEKIEPSAVGGNRQSRMTATRGRARAPGHSPRSVPSLPSPKFHERLV
jgi:hypothetical protein